MKRLAVLVLLALALVPSATVSAAPRQSAPGQGAAPIPAGGEFSATIGSETCTELSAGGPSLVTVTGSYTWSGTLVGSGPIAYRIIISRPCSPPTPPFSSPEVAVGRGSFTGTVNGKSGTFEYIANFRTDGRGHAWGGIVIKHGTGELAGIHGVLRFNDDFVCLECPTSTYAGWVSFKK